MVHLLLYTAAAAAVVRSAQPQQHVGRAFCTLHRRRSGRGMSRGKKKQAGKRIILFSNLFYYIQRGNFFIDILQLLYSVNVNSENRAVVPTAALVR